MFMSNKQNDTILENLLEEILAENPHMSIEAAEEIAKQRFDALELEYKNEDEIEDL